jgi:hypothetical protein
MKPLVLVYPHDHILQLVKQEASHYALRKRDGEGFSLDREDRPLFDLLVFDEAYMTKFRELFFDAQAEIGLLLSAYMEGAPSHAQYLEEEDFDRTVNFRLTLGMEEGWNVCLSKPLDSKIREFMEAYIMYRWLETKQPEDAAVYLARVERLKKSIRGLTDVNRSARLRHGFW